MDIEEQLCNEFSIKPIYCKNIIKLLDEGNTIPFIARYRKEMHGACNDQVLRAFYDRLLYLRNLEERKNTVKAIIIEQGKWTDELDKKLTQAKTLIEVEDIYRPYKQKRKTRASIAIEKGLEPLADIILLQELKTGDVNAIAKPFVNKEKNVNSIEEAINGAKDIIAEKISDDSELRKYLRKYFFDNGIISCSESSEENDKKIIYEMYFNFQSKISDLPAHRILAINRGEKQNALKVKIIVDDDYIIDKINKKYIKDSIFNEIMFETVLDSYERLIKSSIEREIRAELTETAGERAIQMFELNLKPLLLQPPINGVVIMGIDPGYRTGCKVAVINEHGDVLDTAVIYPMPPQSKIDESKNILKKLIDKNNVSVIAIGNGTAGKETEIFVCDLIKEYSGKLSYSVVNEAGASVYSAGKIGAEEFPNYDVALRSAISIARRLLDPLAELIKIDVQSIGVGQYQHDVPQNRLKDVLNATIEDCVNSVGVDLNTASYNLLAHVSGLNNSIAKNIIKYRQNKRFNSREELLNITKLGPKVFEQCAGFLRIREGKNVLDNTAVHPESYEACEKLLKKYNFTYDDVKNNKIKDIKEKLTNDGIENVAASLGIGVHTLNDLVEEILKPGRDIRESLPPPILRADIIEIKDLKEGMLLSGVVRNVIDFGVFVDIGVHQDGLVHISEICDQYLKHPSEVLKVGDIVQVRVLGVDIIKKRISLTMKNIDNNNNVVQNKIKQHTIKRKEKINEENDLMKAISKLQEKLNKR